MKTSPLARDLVIAGGLSALGAPGAFVLYQPHGAYFAVVIAAAMLTAPLVALAYGRAIGDARDRPALMLVTVAVPIGLLWGLLVGAAGGFAEPHHMGWSISLAGMSGAIQLGWLAPCLVRRRSAGRATWPLLAGAAAAAPVLGNLSYWLIGLAASFPGVLSG